MATVTKTVVQNGTKWTVYGEVTHATTSTELATILDFSADIDADPFNRQGFAGYTSSKLVGVTISPQYLTTVPYVSVQFAASSNDEMFEAFSYGVTQVKWRRVAGGGLIDPKSTGYTGDVVFSRIVHTGGSASDLYTFVLSGELI